MNERELSLIKVLGEEFGQVLAEMRDSFSKSIQALKEDYQERLTSLAKQVEEISNAPAPDVESMVKAEIAKLPAQAAPELPDVATMVSEAVAAIPVPRDGKSVTVDDITPVLQELVSNAVAEIPAPKDGKDFDPAMLKQAVEEAVSEAVAAIPVPQDGKSVTTEDVQPMIQELVSASMPELPDVKSLVNEAIAALPAAEPGKDGENGRDALALEILPFIDEGKSYPRGSYATHNGGLWRAYEKTHGMRGWECLVDGVSGIDIQQSEQRNFTLTVSRTSGASETKSFDVPVMIYQGVFKSGQEYLPGDTVTWGGSLWHCDEQTQDKPGEAGSKGWTLAAKRGRDGRDKT
ncbi:phage gp6-like head-tail connector protein [Enterobacter hormaechei]|uniref:phage gp6-like head-tail connector protein n=1 Tax=Enterobacter cloacae complex TaxID=354276 RepID=UPI000F81C46D|nr:phage gp6-like head-tail connector protein [Enterobacter hormaechei]MCM7257032.1 phage gp6-like head-tail connector protein [Enterobacter hormaechei]MCO8007910.1 phage gp6-like head-tail connector protein [Enterobacter hormaechei]MCO8012641.1 phage gp6-like head-tail connector protein [Enterobacter hormaechei]MCU7751257.1 phage gp6-like head-tail connector protein [Enterobacter hormaechei]RTM48608.1 phage gp6-like head-tail connector protein [Enterobacter hormaechei subsp. xiangfangensis]